MENDGGIFLWMKVFQEKREERKKKKDIYIYNLFVRIKKEWVARSPNLRIAALSMLERWSQSKRYKISARFSQREVSPSRREASEKISLLRKRQILAEKLRFDFAEKRESFVGIAKGT